MRRRRAALRRHSRIARAREFSLSANEIRGRVRISMYMEIGTGC
jgi:hypothetical protein